MEENRIVIDRGALLERFLHYVSFDTQSDEHTNTSPSTAGQHVLAKCLADELQSLGAQDVWVDAEHAYVYARIPANQAGSKAPKLGFIAHIDTSDAVSGKDVRPRLVESYDGAEITLNEEGPVILSPAEFPSLSGHTGQTLVVTDGTTLLGADDKAGVAEIMTMAQLLLSDEGRKIPHGEIALAFTPDEEIGEGTKHFDLSRFDADFAYTVDGGALGELEYECFNAAEAELIIHGRSTHPGDAKGRMRHATLIAYEFESMLPPNEKPMYTEGREGFYHLTLMKGTCDMTVCYYILRDHDRALFEQKKTYFRECVEFLNRKYGAGTIELTMEDSYYNMLEQIKPHMHLIRTAEAAIRTVGGTPLERPIRGGTDGARLSFMGLPTPNLCTGGYNYHSRFEYAVVEEMVASCEILVQIARRYAKGVPAVE